MPTDNKQTQPSNQNTQTVTPVMDDMPPVVMEDTTPPMLNTTDLPIANTQTQTTPVVEEKKEETSETDSGSAAPNNDVVMAPVVTTQKKKFAGGRVIATILGLFLLVGGVGAGTLLVQQNQNVAEEASGACGYCNGQNRCVKCTGGATSQGDCANDADCEAGGGVGSGNNTPECYNNNECSGGEICRNGNCVAQNGGDSGLGGQIPTGCTFNSQCASGKACVNGTCQNASTGGYCVGDATCHSGQRCVANNCITISTSSSGSVVGGSCNTTYVAGKVGNGTGGTGVSGTFQCPQSEDTSDGCDQDNGSVISNDFNPASDCFCGTIQVDYEDGTFISYYGNNNCQSGGGGGGGGTPPGDSISAQCQNIKAYSSTWTLLTNTQLSQLKAGDSVNFCVAGSATGGSFNKARFTINSALQAETTTVRPSSTDFCQSYVIPAGTTSFKVSAQINHATLGWK